MAYPSHYGYGMQQIPQLGNQGYGGNPQSLQMLLAYLLAQQQEQTPQNQAQQPNSTNYVEELQRANDPNYNPYFTQSFRPSPAGLSPLGRFNDLAYRQSARLANSLADGKQAVAESTERQRLVDSITHPPPAMPYNISRPSLDAGPVQGMPSSPAYLNSAYGSGSVSFAPMGTVPHGTFGPDNLPFGQIGGAHEAQPLSGTDPEQTTYQQQMLMDIDKAMAKKKKS